MDKLRKPLQLNKKSIQILDDKSMIDIQGGNRTTTDTGTITTCDWGSCKPSWNQVSIDHKNLQ